eukprot:Polyplicarium_translucidae@DN1395_c0_g1_i5.p1
MLRCWNCGEPGHIARFCRKKKRPEPGRRRMQGIQDLGDNVANTGDEVLCIGAVKKKDSPNLLTISGRINGRRVRMLIDSGASNNFIAKKAVGDLGLRAIRSERKRIVLANGSECTANEKCEKIKIEGSRVFKITATVIPSTKEKKR